MFSYDEIFEDGFASRQFNIDPVVPDVRQQPLQRRALGRTAGITAIVITGADQSPAVIGLAADVGLRRLVLGVDGVELLVEPYSIGTRV